MLTEWSFIKVPFPVKSGWKLTNKKHFISATYFRVLSFIILVLSSLKLSQSLQPQHFRTMAATTYSLLRLNSPVSRPSLYNSQGRVFLQRRSWFRAQPRTKPNRTSIIKAEAGVQKEDIVIVGAGIAGLATAVSLHRCQKITFELNFMSCLPF